MSAGHAKRRVVQLADRQFMSLSEEARIVYEGHSRGDTLDDIGDALFRTCGRRLNRAELEHVAGALLRNVETASRQRRAPTHVFRIPLLSAHRVNVLAERLIWMFDPRIATAVVTFSLASCIPAFGDRTVVHASTIEWLGAYALLFASVLMHEFGHATACRAGRAWAGCIGLTAFFIFPALYTDVSQAWLLPRKRRLAVDLGGMYFQLPALAACALASTVTHEQSFRLAVILIGISIAINLNPVLKLDGYWLLADVLDLPNLSREPLALLRGIWTRRLAPRPLWCNIVISIFGALNLAALIYAGASSASLLLHRPAQLVRSIATVRGDHVSTASLLNLSLSVATFLLLAYGVANLARTAYTHLLHLFGSGK